MAHDFLDDDVLGGSGADESDLPLNSISAAGLNRMAKQKKDLTNQMAGAAREVEQLRLRQNELERERNDLESFAKKQSEYEEGKREIIEKLDRGVILVEKEENQATRMCELLSETSVRFKKMLSELAEIDEGSWADENYQVELNRALVRVDIAQTDYKKAMARIDATSWHKGVGKKVQGMVEREAASSSAVKLGLGYWLKVGLGVTLPIMGLLVVLFALWMYFMGHWPEIK